MNSSRPTLIARLLALIIWLTLLWTVSPGFSAERGARPHEAAITARANAADDADGGDEPLAGRRGAFSGEDPWALVGRAVVVLAVVAGIAYAMRPRYDFVVTSAGGRVTVRGRMPANLRAAAVEFFERDFPPAARCKVLGRYRGNRTLELNFRGVRSPGDRQRIRNVLSVNR